MPKLALLFSGQGSHYVGMGLDYKSPLFHQAHDILGYCPKDILDDQKKLDQTLFAQPLIVLKSLLGFESLRKDMIFDGVLGFSLGEYSALNAAGVFSFEEIMKLVSLRANLMQEATLIHPGAMTAVIGLSEHNVQKVCDEIDDCLIANFNTPSQYVISGTVEAVENASKRLKEAGARRVVRLNVSGAFHSPLMAQVSAKYEHELRNFKPHKPHVPIYMNKTGSPLMFKELTSLMAAQISHPVQFIKSIEKMVDDGFTHFLEIGPGRTLSGFVRKINRDLNVMNFDKFEQLNDVKGWLKTHGFNK